MQQGLNLRCSIKRTDYESIAFDHSAMHAAQILSVKAVHCKRLKVDKTCFNHNPLTIHYSEEKTRTTSALIWFDTNLV